MQRSDVEALYYIVLIATVPSILQHGILSHNEAEKFKHKSIAMTSVQKIRSQKQIPGARTLHDYANLYFNARNPMLYVRRNQNDTLCVLKIKHQILDEDGVIVTNYNAAAHFAGFFTVDRGLKAIDKERLAARYWTHPESPLDEKFHRAEMCAETLVEDCVPTDYIFSALVANRTAEATFDALDTDLPVHVCCDIFF